ATTLRLPPVDVTGGEILQESFLEFQKWDRTSVKELSKSKLSLGKERNFYAGVLKFVGSETGKNPILD
ncbi:MAG: hypothetical protein K2L97_06910, partial [Muribaculaceae bacterium]|nr:hypothetical protein [Muribaculaceae bacterium]